MSAEPTPPIVPTPRLPAEVLQVLERYPEIAGCIAAAMEKLEVRPGNLDMRIDGAPRRPMVMKLIDPNGIAHQILCPPGGRPQKT